MAKKKAINSFIHEKPRYNRLILTRYIRSNYCGIAASGLTSLVGTQFESGS